MTRQKLYQITGLGTAVFCTAGMLAGCGTAETVSSSSSEVQEAVLPEEQDLSYDYTSAEGIVVEPGAHVAVVVKGLGENTYWDVIRQGVEAAVNDVNEEMGFKDEQKVTLTFEGPDEENNEEEQINTLDAVLAENPTVLCLSAVDVESGQAQLETAADNEIPVLIVDAGIESDLVTAVCQTDNTAAGQAAADKICEKLNGEGKVALICHQPTTETSQLRSEGFLEVLEEYPDIEVVCTLEDDGETPLEEQLAAMKEEYPDLDGIFATNESCSIAVLQAYGEEENHPAIIGFDNGEEQIQAIQDGLEYGCISQNPYSMGYAVVIASLRAAAGEEVDSFIDTGFVWLDQTNIDDPDNQIYLYQ